MHCVFCKKPSDDSKSREHILPESLGNELHVLAPGIVCDGCNNYFSTKIEGPVLSSPYFKCLRFQQKIPNKKGVITPQSAVIWPDNLVTLRYHPEDGELYIDVPDECAELVCNLEKGELIIPMSGPGPEPALMSRFLAKMAYEAFVKRQIEAGVFSPADIIRESALDPIREWVRFGKGCREWKYSERQIYHPDTQHTAPGSPEFQILHEWTFFGTDAGELFFCVAIFGVEYVINLAGASVEGYADWLSKNDDGSPLYNEKKK